MAIKLKADEVLDRFKNLYNNEYELITEYVSNSSGGIIHHKICNTNFKLSRLTRFFNESSLIPCPICRKNNSKKNIKIPIHERIESKYPNQFEIVSFSKMHDKIILKCKKCKKEFNVARAEDLFLKNRFCGCPNCRINKRGKFQQKENYLNSILESKGVIFEYKWMDNYKGKNNLKHKIKHFKCNNEFFIRPVDFISGSRCPFCFRKESKEESNFKNEIINKIGNSNFKLNDRSILNPYELDIHFLDFKIGIEYNGLYWHSTERKDKTYHNKKRDYAFLKNIKLIQIYSDDWQKDSIKNITYNKILTNFFPYNKINLDENLFYCSILNIDNKYKEIINHFQFYKRTNNKIISIILKYKNIDIAIGLFERISEKYSWNLIDILPLKPYFENYYILIIQYFYSLYKPRKIISYLNLDIFDKNNNYLNNLNFKKGSEILSLKFLTDGHKRFSIKEKYNSLYTVFNSGAIVYYLNF